MTQTKPTGQLWMWSLVSTIAVFILLALGAALFLALKNGDESPRFRTEKIVRGDIVETVSATGVLNPVNTILVGTQVSGTVSHIYADFNSIVKKGQLIAEIDSAIFEAKLDQSKANLLQAGANPPLVLVAISPVWRGSKLNPRKAL